MKKRIFYFDEDLIDIPVFIPLENLGIMQGYIDSYEKQLEKGYIKLPKEKVSFEERKIEFIEVDNIFGKILLPYDEVRLEISPNEIEHDSFAYGQDNILILGMFDIKQKFKIVTNLAIYKGFESNRDAILIDNLSKAVFKFCREKKLIIFDDFTRRDKKIIQAKSLKTIKNYLKTPWQRSTQG